MAHRRLFLSALATALVAVATGAEAQPYGPPPYRPIPELRHEEMPPPRRGFLWEPGHWHWNGRDYVWISGRYIPGRERYRVYVPGRWERRGPGWIWVPAHWE